MSVQEILSFVNALLNDWGVMPFITAMLIIMMVIGAIVAVRRMFLGS